MFLRIARLVPGLGIVFAALVVVGVILGTGSPGTTESDQSWTKYYADSGNRTKEEISFVLHRARRPLLPAVPRQRPRRARARRR